MHADAALQGAGRRQHEREREREVERRDAIGRSTTRRSGTVGEHPASQTEAGSKEQPNRRPTTSDDPTQHEGERAPS